MMNKYPITDTGPHNSTSIKDTSCQLTPSDS